MIETIKQGLWLAVITEKDRVATFLRVTLFINIFPIGLLNAGFLQNPTYRTMVSWMNGYGMEMGLCHFVLIGEVISPLLILFGLCTRVATLILMSVLFLQMYYLQLTQKFFMNWGGAPPPNSEGLEFHFLAFFMLFALLEKGGGTFSIDQVISKITIERGAPLSLG